MSSMLERILDKERLSLQLVQTGNNGATNYYYVIIQRSRKQEFEELVAAGVTDFAGIGTVIASGEGIPPQDMEEKVLAMITAKEK